MVEVNWVVSARKKVIISEMMIRRLSVAMTNFL